MANSPGLKTGALQQLLDIQGSQLITLPGGVQAVPVAVVEDFAKTLATAPVEPRALTGASVQGLVGFWPVIEILAVGRSIELETLIVEETGGTGANIIVTRGAAQRIAPPPGVTVPLTQIGGDVTARAVVQSGTSNVSPLTFAGAEIPGPRVELSQLRFVLQPGEWLSLASSIDAGTQLVGCFAWREFLDRG